MHYVDDDYEDGYGAGSHIKEDTIRAIEEQNEHQADDHHTDHGHFFHEHDETIPEHLQEWHDQGHHGHDDSYNWQDEHLLNDAHPREHLNNRHGLH